MEVKIEMEEKVVNNDSCDNADERWRVILNRKWSRFKGSAEKPCWDFSYSFIQK